MTKTEQKRLADIRMQNAIASAEYDTTHWESTFFLGIIDEQNRMIQELKK